MDVTVELDGLGRQLSELPGPAAETSRISVAQTTDSSDGPVFVDESGRRSKKLRRLGWVLAIASACYAVALVAALIGGSSSAPWLQIPGVSDKRDADKVEIQQPPSDRPTVETTPGAGDLGPSPSDSASGSPSSTGPSADGSPSPDPSESASGKPDPDPKPGGADPDPDPGGDPDPGTVDPGPGPGPGETEEPGTTDPGTDPGSGEPTPPDTPTDTPVGDSQQVVAEGSEQ
ncbi:hypothetical protein OG875_19960 [Streptomyces sp. NBC_01498]|uniref:hypothetical protein n=1 Tax=Streptomyces sp. NBC_01498 TaxID=2975870 RepID=UPI002E7B32D0|nr:hypothetical protein [Streptomyces sp. NBC_01498]WTL26639.1 hypothetical protein OG875_19960 [Streptomyces sp. NBC_01498]